MNNTQFEKITLKCTVTGELVTYRGWDYISKRIEKAGSLEILEKTFVCRKGARLQMSAGKFKARSLSNGNKAILPAMTVDTPVKPKKVKQTKEESVASFNKPKGYVKPIVEQANFEARLCNGEYIFSKNGVEYARMVTKE